MNLKMIKSLLYLGVYFVLHLLKKLFHLGQRNSTEFKLAYLDDHIFAISAKHRHKMPEYSSCHSCRLCDTVCPELATSPTLLAPSFLVSCFSRSLTDFTYSDTNFSCQNCKLCEEICPQNVPIRSILDFIQEGKKLSA